MFAGQKNWIVCLHLFYYLDKFDLACYTVGKHENKFAFIAFSIKKKCSINLLKPTCTEKSKTIRERDCYGM